VAVGVAVAVGGIGVEVAGCKGVAVGRTGVGSGVLTIWQADSAIVNNKNTDTTLLFVIFRSVSSQFSYEFKNRGSKFNHNPNWIFNKPSKWLNQHSDMKR
jgi:hypothetical protein